MAEQPVPPSDLDAEASVLAESMGDETCIVFDEVREILGTADLYSTANRFIFEAMSELRDAGQPIDLVSVSRRLKDKDKFNAAYFEQISTATPAARPALRAHAHSIKEKSRLRQLIAQLSTLRALAYTDHGAQGVQEFLERAEAEIATIAHSTSNGKLASVNQLMDEVNKAVLAAKDDPHKNKIDGVPTGFIDLDDMTGGLHEGDFRIVAARPGQGKTALILDEAVRVAGKGYGVAFFSLEMPAIQLGYRMVSSAARIESKALRTGQLPDGKWPVFTNTIEDLRKLPIWIDDTPDLTMPQLRARLRRLQSEIAAGKHPQATQKRIGCVYVDYLQLMQSPESGNKYATRENLVSAISRGFKSMAKELNLPVTCAAQLNREVEKRGDKRPWLSDLRESGSMEMDADTILFIYRAEYYNPGTDKGLAEINIAKQRNGATGKKILSFTAEYTRFDNGAVGQEWTEDRHDEWDTR